MESTGYILAAAAIAAANEAIFLPATEGKPLWADFNWRLVPATAVAALTIGGLEKISPPLGKWLGILALLSVLIVPMGKGPSPVENATRLLGMR